MPEEPHIEEDIEVHFTTGEPLFVYGLVQGRDRTNIADDAMTIYQEIEGGKSVMRIDLSKVNCWRVTQRTVEPEPKVPGE